MEGGGGGAAVCCGLFFMARGHLRPIRVRKGEARPIQRPMPNSPPQRARRLPLSFPALNTSPLTACEQNRQGYGEEPLHPRALTVETSMVCEGTAGR